MSNLKLISTKTLTKSIAEVTEAFEQNVSLEKSASIGHMFDGW